MGDKLRGLWLFHVCLYFVFYLFLRFFIRLSCGLTADSEIVVMYSGNVFKYNKFFMKQER